MTRALPFLAGLVMALGLGLAGMTQPAKVLAFLDVTRDWDPSLMFVMAGAIPVYAAFYRFSLRAARPFGAPAFERAAVGRLDAPLLAGAAIFGVGWGLVGICPGPAIVALGGGDGRVLLFVLGLVGGLGLFALWKGRPRGS